MARRNGNNGNETAEPNGSALYEVLKGIDFERRELVDKSRGVGLFDLVRGRDGDYRCYSCTLCEKACPVDCIEIDYSPEYDERWRPCPARAAAPARPASWATSRSASCPNWT
jgi:ferredoxin